MNSHISSLRASPMPPCTAKRHSTELIFVTNITNHICGEKIVMRGNFGKIWGNFGEILGNFEKFWEILPQFTRFHVEKN